MLISVNGIEINYERSGQGHPLILLHCNSHDHTFFNDLVKRLGNKFTVYALDSRCHGKSSVTPVLTYEDMAEDVACFINELKLEKPFLCGSSDGGNIGLILASKYPDILSKLVVCGACTSVSGNKPSMVKFIRLFHSIMCKSKNPKQIVQAKKFELMLNQREITKADLQKITVPTLVLAGSKDSILNSHTCDMASHIQNHSLIILNGEGHVSYIKKSKKLCEVMLPFLEK